MPESNKVRPSEIHDAENVFSVYCNSTSLGFTPWDVRAEIMELVGSGRHTVTKRHGTIVMSPAHAKAFLNALVTTIQKYEDQFGPIDLSKIEAALSRPDETP